MAIEEQTFTVDAKGIGKPDNFKGASPTRPFLGAGQRQWNGIWVGAVGALSQVAVPIYTGTTGWRLYFAGGWLFCDANIIQTAQIDIERPPLPFLPIMIFGYQLQAHAGWTDPAVVLIEENQNMRFLINNLDIAAHNFTLTCLGMEEKV